MLMAEYFISFQKPKKRRIQVEFKEGSEAEKP
jgi:hypothetical protein